MLHVGRLSSLCLSLHQQTSLGHGKKYNSSEKMVPQIIIYETTGKTLSYFYQFDDS